MSALDGALFALCLAEGCGADPGAEMSRKPNRRCPVQGGSAELLRLKPIIACEEQWGVGWGKLVLELALRSLGLHHVVGSHTREVAKSLQFRQM